MQRQSYLAFPVRYGLRADGYCVRQTVQVQISMQLGMVAMVGFKGNKSGGKVPFGRNYTVKTEVRADIDKHIARVIPRREQPVDLPGLEIMKYTELTIDEVTMVQQPTGVAFVRDEKAIWMFDAGKSF